MSGIEDIENSMDVPDPEVVVGENAKKRGTESPTSSANKKLKLDPTEGEIPASAFPSSLGNGTASDQQNPESVQDEGEVQVQLDATDSSPPDEVGIPPVSDIQEEEPSTSQEPNHVIDLDGSVETPVLTEEEVDKIYAHLPQLKKKAPVAEENAPGDQNLSSQSQETILEAVLADNVPTQQLEELVVVLIDPAQESAEQGIAFLLEDQDAEQEGSQTDSDSDNSPLLLLEYSSEETLSSDHDSSEETPDFNQVSSEATLVFYQDSYEATLDPEDLELARSQVELEAFAAETASPPQRYSPLAEDDCPVVSRDSHNSTSPPSNGTSSDESQDDDDDSENYSSDSDEDQGGQVPEDDEAATSYLLNLRVKSNRRALEVVTDLRPRVRLNKEQTVKFKDFKLLRVIGNGAYGKVFVVRKETGFDDGQVYAMKVVSKMASIRTLGTAQAVKCEREVLEAIQGEPFMVCLQYAFQTRRYLFLVMDFVRGGELYTHVLRRESLPEWEVRIYLAEVVLALEQLHKQNILYRDLKLENILIDEEGHIVLADLGLAGIVTAETDYQSHDFCGTLEYMAPEVIQMRPEGYGKPADWWSLGVLTIELLTGTSPFSRPHLSSREKHAEISRLVLEEDLEIPTWFSPEAVDLMQKLLERDPSKRLGASEVRVHPFFRDIDWAVLRDRRHRMPFKPNLDSPDDVQHFDSEFTSETAVLPRWEATPRRLRIYKGFNYTAPKFLEWARYRKDEGVKYRNLGVQHIAPPPENIVLGRRVYSGIFAPCFQVHDNAMAKVVHLSNFRVSEVDALMSFSHSNIAKLMHVFRHKTEMWIITECVWGMDLSWRIRNTLVTEQFIRKIFLQLVSAVSHMHSKGFIHGDLRPENVMFENDSYDAQIKLVDFGYASYNREFVKWQDKPRYTLDYAPPELLDNTEHAVYSPAVDSYGLGATLYSTAVGHPPFRQDVDDVDLSPKTRALLKKFIQRRSPNRLADKWLKASPAFRKLVRWCLRKLPEARPQLKDIQESAWLNGVEDQDSGDEKYKEENYSDEEDDSNEEDEKDSNEEDEEDQEDESSSSEESEEDEEDEEDKEDQEKNEDEDGSEENEEDEDKEVKNEDTQVTQGIQKVAAPRMIVRRRSV